MARKQVIQVGPGIYDCPQCEAEGRVHVRNHARPHCMECGQHHPLHLDCKGKATVINIPHAQLFYSFPNDEILKA